MCHFFLSLLRLRYVSVCLHALSSIRRRMLLCSASPMSDHPYLSASARPVQQAYGAEWSFALPFPLLLSLPHKCRMSKCRMAGSSAVRLRPQPSMRGRLPHPVRSPYESPWQIVLQKWNHAVNTAMAICPSQLMLPWRVELRMLKANLESDHFLQSIMDAASE